MSYQIDHTVDFANWWMRSFPGTPCPVLPKKPEDLNFTQRMTLQSDNPVLYQNLFGNGGLGSAPMPADTVARRNTGELQAQDIAHLRNAGLEWEAKELEKRVSLQQDQRLADQAASSRENFIREQQRAAEWAQMGILARMGHQPIDPAVAARNRAKWGISE